MAAEVKSLLAKQARSGVSLYYPDPEVEVTFNFDQGVAAQESFPLQELRRLHDEVIERDGPLALEYISLDRDLEGNRVIYRPTFIELALGYTGLREQVANWTGQRHGRTDLGADGVILTSGAVQAIALAASAFIEPGEGALVEAGTFPYALRFLELRGAKTRAVALDHEGMRVDDLEMALREMRDEGIRPKLLYTIPTFQMPTGATAGIERRRRILELAEEWDLIVIEDYVFGDLRYSGEDLPSLFRMDSGGRVLQINGFGKTVAPALRLGWMCGSEELISGIASIREDLGVNQWTCRAMELFLSRGLMDSQLERSVEIHRGRRDAAADALTEHCEPWVTFDLPDGGFFLWLSLNEGVDWDAVSAEVAAHGVAIRPGEQLMDRNCVESGPPFMRLAFSHAPEHEIERGIACLGQALARA